MKNYHIKLSTKSNAPGTWESTIVEIYLDKEKIGEYIRNYPSFSEGTFFPFQQNGKDYALYSRDYTSTRVMELPSCKDICGEQPNAFGFCPVEYYVPQESYSDEEFNEYKEWCEKENYNFDLQKLNGQYGFVAGCIWGDDTSWKIQFLDLSKISEGILTRDDRFGYIELMDGMSLKNAVNFGYFENGSDIIHLAIRTGYKLNGEKI